MGVEAWEWRYTLKGNVAHAIVPARMEVQSWDLALCGRWPMGDWYGTGEQREYERAAKLPRCRDCLKQIARPTRTH